MVSEDSKASAASSTPVDRALGQAYLLYAASLLLVVTLGAALQLVSVTVGLVVTELVLILGPALWFVRRKGLAVGEALRLRPITALDGLLAVAVGVTGWGAAAGIVTLSVRVLGEPPPVPGLQARSLPHLLWILFCAAVLPGICEEGLFRGVLQGLLRRRGKGWAVLMTALLFAAYHLHPWIFLPALFLGVVFGTLVQRTGSLLPAILAHTATNTMAYTAVYRFGGEEDPAAYRLMAVLAAACLVTFPLAWLHTRGRDPAPPRLASVPAAAGRLLPWLAGIAAAALALVLVALLILGVALVGVVTVPGDDLEPQYHRGDHLILFKAGTVPLDLEVGDVVTFEVEGERRLGTITRLEEDDEVDVEERGTVHRLSRSRITAKVVHVVSGAKP